MLRFTRAGVLH